MDIIIMIICVTVVLGVLVFIHEGGHYLAARALGVRVTEFMLGLPAPSIGFKHGETRFGITILPLGGYARVCGMEAGEMHPRLEEVLDALNRRGTANMEDIAADLDMEPDDAMEALDELVEWGCAVAPLKQDEFNTYRTPEYAPSKRARERAKAKGIELPPASEQGAPRAIDDPHAFFESEYKKQYRSLPFWKRSIILLAGIFMNLLFAIVVFVLIYSVIGVDIQSTDTGEVTHYVLAPLRSIQAGFMYIGMVVQAVIGLFNPATAAETVQNSTSIVGIAVMSKSYADAGILNFLMFMAMISVSLGIMNLVPIPPLDGGRFIVEIFQKILRKTATTRVMNGLTTAGLIIFIGFFVIMLNQDIQRFVFGNWG